MEVYCVNCLDAVALRKVFEEASAQFLKPRSTKKMARSLNPQNSNYYETWHDFKSNDDIMKIWGHFYEAIRDNNAGLKILNELKLSRPHWDDINNGEGI